ncbi:(2Fe-2S)-binding protein [Streptomyces sp. 8L]|uniref:(2Fe-2S)-binding protein n=1 Tax=Streptomyces sp. 8L TaxID=2877242 RepID=UPI001CD3DC21|nr:(2Fe-2S)-binding protein [Streptomyces sp. 8L]MCA1221181.1 (2Fe-2S)-binding protein [Streptomyces sp. 8L]
MYVCSCFGITEAQVKQHAEAGACTPRQIASRCKAGTDCGGCVRRIQSILGRGACPSRELLGGRADVPAGAETASEPVAARQDPVLPGSPADPFATPAPAEPFTPAPVAAEAAFLPRAA